MPIVQSRRRFLTSLTLTGAAGLGGLSAVGLGGARNSLAEEGPPETTTVRLRFEDTPPSLVNGVSDVLSCNAPVYIAKELLFAEGFTDIRYVPVKGGPAFNQALVRGEFDFSLMFAPGLLRRLDASIPITALAGIHSGCFELFAQEHIRSFSDLKGKQVGVEDPPGAASQLYVSIIAAHVGLDPKKDIKWVTPDDVPNPIDLFVRGKIDAYLAFVPEPQDLRARKIGHVIVDMALDKPWANYFCCLLVGSTDFVRNYPVATKRVLRAILKTSDLCAGEPERASRRLVEDGFVQHYDLARDMIMAIPYATWRELDSEDTLRFYALWLHEIGAINSAPNKLIAEGTDWRFLNELKRELKA